MIVKESRILPSSEALLRSSPLAIVMTLVSLQFLISYPSYDKGCLPPSATIDDGDGNINHTFSEHPQISSFNYSWIGDHWFAPPGVPRYTPEQMKDTFSNLNILWTGDSTCRQNMHTMFNMINASDYSDITINTLNHSINENKKNRDRKCVDRDFSKSTVLGHNHDPYSFTCRNIPGVDSSSSSSSSNNNTSYPSQLPSTNIIPSKGKFDYSKSPCPDILSQIAIDELNGTLTSTLNGYDWLVVDLGIWEVEHNLDCRRHNESEPTRIRIDNTLELMERLASPRLSILWKTTGTVENMTSSHLEGRNDLNTQVRQWFASRNPNHMYLIDWAQQIEPRSDDENRISGDTYAHWGWAARLLAVQMVTHAVVTMQPQKQAIHHPPTPKSQ